MHNFRPTAIAIGFLVMVFAMVGWSDEPSLKLEFSGASLEANPVTVEGAGFGSYPKAEVSFGLMPTDNAFVGATDGQGMIITADPGEGVMVFAPKMTLNEAAMVRCSIRTEQPHAAVAIATIGDKPSEFISQNTPNDPSYFTGKFMRLATFCQPPSGGFQPLIQVVNTSPTDPLTAYLDNFEVFRLDPNRYYSAAFLDGDESDPPALRISLPAEGGLGVTPPGGAGSTLTVQIPLGGYIPLEMVYIPAGTFTMGSPDSEKERFVEEGPQHQVTLTEGFYLGKYEVTQAQWRAVMGGNPSYFTGDNLPVEQVSWDDCQTFIQKLNQLGQGTFRLPTEAEWEYACRAGSTTRYYWGEDLNNTEINKYAWDSNNPLGRTHFVGLKLPNAWGLYDMSGNVGEWCQDRYGNYSADPQQNPTGPDSGLNRVVRGGHWGVSAGGCRSAVRGGSGPRSVDYYLGFRVSRTP